MRKGIVVWILLASAAPVMFEPVQPALFGTGGTLTNAWADYDGDGDLDLVVGFNGEPNRLYANDGGVFRDMASAAGVADARPTRATAWGDYDGDGDPDLLMGFAPGGPVLRLYRNESGRFQDATPEGLAIDSVAVRQPVWVDYDDDGDLDLFVAYRDRANALYRNDAGEFTDIAASIGLDDTRRSVGAAWFDFDADGDLDLIVGNMDGDANGLFRNDAGRFTDVADAMGVQWGGRAAGEPANGTVRPCAADVDADGRLDLFFANYGSNGLFLNHGDRFADASSAWGIDLDSRYDSCAFADFDNDGRLDLYVNGTVTGGTSYPDHLYRNTGDRFEEVTPENVAALEADHGVQWADYDGDGAIDLALTGARPSGTHALLRNRGIEGGSVRVRVVDGNGHALLAGAEVRVSNASTGRLIGMRLVDSGSGYDSQSDAPVHIGTGDAATVDIEVVWPGSGRRVTARVEAVRVAEALGEVTVVRVNR